MAKQFDGTALWPEQAGHPCSLKALFLILAVQIWSSSSGHFQTIFLWLPAVKPSGLRSPFLLGCHSLTSSGWVSASDFLDLAIAVVCRLNIQYSMSLCNFGKRQNPEPLYQQRVPPFRFEPVRLSAVSDDSCSEYHIHIWLNLKSVPPKGVVLN